MPCWPGQRWTSSSGKHEASVPAPLLAPCLALSLLLPPVEQGRWGNHAHWASYRPDAQLTILPVLHVRHPSHSTDKGTEAHRGQMTCPRSCNLVSNGLLFPKYLLCDSLLWMYMKLWTVLALSMWHKYCIKCLYSIVCLYGVCSTVMSEAGPTLALEALWGHLGDPLGHSNPIGCSPVWCLQLQSWLCHLSAEWPWASFYTFSSSVFLICRMETVLVPTSQDGHEEEMR